MFQPTIDLDSLWTTLPAEQKLPLRILPVLCKFYRQNKQSVKYYGGKNDKNGETADMIFHSENFAVITQLLRWSMYIIHKKDVSQSD